MYPSNVWDVRTNKDRYWVITNPDNLYSQKLSPSMDYTLSFHIGVTARVAARQAVNAPEEKTRISRLAWRLWERAAEELEKANESESIQAVGLTLRESLIAFSSSVASDDIIIVEEEAPKAGDFVKYSQLFADTIACGLSSKETRTYLKTLSKSTWQFINWLTHSSSVVYFDGLIAVDAVSTLLFTFDMALVRYEKGTPTKCPKCSSYRVVNDYRSDTDEYVTLCEACGWTEHDQDTGSV